MQDRRPVGVKQRDVIRMSPAEVDSFLHQRHTMTVSTLSLRGDIHSVAMWYGFLADGRVAFETKRKSQKVLNLMRDPRITCLVDAGATYSELTGVELVGTCELRDDPATLRQVAVSVLQRYRGLAEPTEELISEATRNRVAVVVIPSRVVSWDHRKLGKLS